MSHSSKALNLRRELWESPIWDDQSDVWVTCDWCLIDLMRLSPWPMRSTLALILSVQTKLLAVQFVIRALEMWDWKRHHVPGVRSMTNNNNCCCHCSVAQSCLTLCYSLDWSSPGSSAHGILQARILEWVAIFFSRGSSWPRDQTWVSCVSSITGGFFICWAIRKAPIIIEYMPTHLCSPFLPVPRNCSVKDKCASRRSRELDLYPTAESTCGDSLMNYIPEWTGQEWSVRVWWIGPYDQRDIHTAYTRSHLDCEKNSQFQ